MGAGVVGEGMGLAPGGDADDAVDGIVMVGGKHAVRPGHARASAIAVVGELDGAGIGTGALPELPQTVVGVGGDQATGAGDAGHVVASVVGDPRDAGATGVGRAGGQQRGGQQAASCDVSPSKA